MKSMERIAHLITNAQTMLSHVSTMCIISDSVGSDVSMHDRQTYSILYKSVKEYVSLYNHMKQYSCARPVRQTYIIEDAC